MQLMFRAASHLEKTLLFEGMMDHHSGRYDPVHQLHRLEGAQTIQRVVFIPTSF